MRVEDAKALARRWVADEAETTPGFAGAFFAGSMAWLPDDAAFPATSDVDLWVAIDGPEAPAKRGKFPYAGVILDVSSIALDRLPPAEDVLADYHVAGAFHAPNVIADPTGRLSELQEAVSRAFARREWVEQRCAHARDHSLRYVRSLDENAPLHDQVLSWVFAAGVTTHVLLVAGLRNPTVRRRYAAVRELLIAYGRAGFHEELLALLGCAALSRERVERHLDALAGAVDAAAAMITTPVVFAGDLTQAARPIAIEGSRELIEQGLHREAIFWIAVTYARCMKVLANDAPELYDEHDRGFRELLRDLGIESTAGLQKRAALVAGSLPRIWEVARAIMAANPEIAD